MTKKRVELKALRELSIPDRVRAAVKLLKAEAPGDRLSVVKVCDAAGVNRSNLYEYHDRLLDEILPERRRKAKRGDTEDDSLLVRFKKLTRDLAHRDVQYKALLNVCIEQQAEIRALHLQLGEDTASGNTAAKPKPPSRRK